MKATKIILAALFGAIATQAAGSTLLGSRGEFTTFLGRLEWSAGSRCYKPIKPYSRDKFAMDSYKQSILRYADCIKEAADNDAKYAVDIVYEGYKKEIANLKSELQRGY